MRDTAYDPDHDAAFVTCGEQRRYVAALGIDYKSGLADWQYFAEFDRAMNEPGNVDDIAIADFDGDRRSDILRVGGF
ncbi:MAG: hypothetical protein IPM54_30205 [Polyangiaceae bacterium]|nr:hypothetical protein [Polyangiaceae bacterium]